MASAKHFTLKTKIGELQPAKMHEICNRLQINQNWRTLGASVRRLHNKEPMFSFHDLEIMEQYGPRSSRNLITTLMTHGYTIGMLISALTEVRLYWIADYLAVDILGGASVIPREPPEPERPEPIPPSPVDNRCVPPYGTSHPPGHPTEKSDEPPGVDVREKEYNVDLASLPGQDAPLKDAPGASLLSGHEGLRFDYSQLKRLTNDFDDIPKHKGGHLIGHGGASAVFYAKKDDTDEIAIKRFEGQRTHSEEQFNNEMKLLPGIQHERILPLLGFAIGPTMYSCLIYPYMSNGSLMDKLAIENRDDVLGVPERIRIVIGTAEALKYLHGKGFVHRDVKSANILLDAKFNPKLADFGIARQISSKPKLKTNTQVVCGSMGYMAQEVITQYVGYELDIYSFGVILLEILTGLKPYDSQRESRGSDPCLYDYVPNSLEEFYDEHFLDEGAQSWDRATVSRIFLLARKCLLRRKDLRPDIAAVLTDLKESNV